MAEWKVGKMWNYDECPVTANSKYGGEDIEVRIVDNSLTIETRVGYPGSYGGCDHCVEPCVPMDVLVELLRANGYKVEKG